MTERDDEMNDRDLFLDAVGSVRRMHHDQAPRGKPKPRPVPLQTQLDERRVLEDMLSDEFLSAEVQPGDVLCHLTSGISQQTLRRLRRGDFRREATIDLHGMTVDTARHALIDFLAEGKVRGWRCVKVIHGKGLRSSNRGPILKARIAGWLQQRKDVLAFCSAPPRDGGTGAVYVLLRAPSV